MKKIILISLVGFNVNANTIFTLNPSVYSNSLSVQASSVTPPVVTPPVVTPPVNQGLFTGYSYQGTGNLSVYGTLNASESDWFMGQDGNDSTTTKEFWNSGSQNAIIQVTYSVHPSNSFKNKSFTVKWDDAVQGAGYAEVAVMLVNNGQYKRIYYNANQVVNQSYSSNTWTQRSATGTGEDVTAVVIYYKGLSSGVKYYFRVREITVN